MCRQVMCIACEKPSWAGCGAHIEEVLSDVPPHKRCHCREDAPASVRAQPPSSRRNPDFGKRVSLTPNPPSSAPVDAPVSAPNSAPYVPSSQPQPASQQASAPESQRKS